MQVVPQYIDVEDRIVGPLTWKHIGWLFAGGGILVVVWTIFDSVTFFIIAAVIAPIFIALAFAKPGGVTLIEYIGYGLHFLFRPRLYTWQREAQPVQKPKPQKKEVKIKTKSAKEQLTTADIAALAQTLDSRGVERNKRLQEIMREHVKTNNQ